MAARPGTTFVRIEKRFGIAEANRLRDALRPLAPIPNLTIDFSGAEHLDDAALSVIAEMLTAMPPASVRLDGLTQHRRRLLRYMGVHEARARSLEQQSGA